MTAFYDTVQILTNNFTVFRFLAINSYQPGNGWNRIKMQKYPTARDMT